MRGGNGRGVNLSEGRSADGFAVLCRVGARIYAIPVEHVVETMRPRAVEPLPGAPDFVLGLCLARGAVIPVMDLARMLGTAESAATTRFVTIKTGTRNAALAVDAVLGVARLPDGPLERMPAVVDGPDIRSVTAVGKLDSDLLFVLSGTEVVPESVWSLLDARESAR